jgi:hypothetical protein
MNKSQEEIYNIEAYTDEEMYNILDLHAPSDGELEAKLIIMMKRYYNMQNEAGNQLYQFFYNMYEHFFNVEDDQDGDDDDDDDDEYQGETIIEGLTSDTNSDRKENPTPKDSRYEYKISYPNSPAPVSASIETTDILFNRDKVPLRNTNLPMTDASILAMKTDISNNGQPVNTISGQPANTPITGTTPGTKDASPGQAGTVTAPQQSSLYTKQLSFTSGQTNPLLKESIQRIISIDSQYRDKTTYSLSTDFTFNLSDTLQDVVTLSLYSIQIPYTWYTINNNFGGNFFYLKGNSPGINNGNHDFQMTIPSGNYTPTSLIKAIQDSISTQITTYTDVSFGTTDISYNSTNAITTITIDMNILYNETNYQLYFPTWSNPTNSTLRNTTIPGFLGFNSTTYVPNSIYSRRTNINLSKRYTITPAKNTLYIVHYQGHNAFTPTSILLDVIPISLYTNLQSTTQTCQDIINTLNTQLATSNQLDPISSIQIINASNVDPFNPQQFQMTIQLSRTKTQNLVDSKTIVLFPQETTTDTNNPNLWTGDGSCFKFINTTTNVQYIQGTPSITDGSYVCIETNNIVSESPTVVTNYQIVSQPYIKLTCTRPGYKANDGYQQVNGNGPNDYIITVPNSSTIGYTLDEYINAINNALIQVSNIYANTDNTFDTPFDIAVDSATTKARFTFNIHKNYYQQAYVMDLSNSFLYTNMGLQSRYGATPYIIDIGEDPQHTNIFTSKFPLQGGGYKITNQNNMIQLYPVATGNKYSGTITITIQPGIYPNYTSLGNAIQNAFHAYNGSYNGTSLDMTLTSLTLTQSDTYINATLTVVINNILTENDYDVTFVDPSNTTGLWTSSTNTWYTNLFLPKATFTLSQYAVSNQTYSVITGTQSIQSNSITITNTNNSFQFQALQRADGLYTKTFANDVTITIPNGQYTKESLFTTINGLFAANPLTKNTTISSYTDPTTGFIYTQIRASINKVYTAQDYRLVFYDPYSFVKCNVGVKGKSSIRNATWDTTLGWILGFHSNTEYSLSSADQDSFQVFDACYNAANNIINGSTNPNNYQIDLKRNIVKLSGDTVLNLNLYNYLLIVLDDYVQNHLNDGLVTITTKQTSIPLPSYANRTTYQCDPITGKLVAGGTTTTYFDKNNQRLTQNQVYAANEILTSQKNQTKSYSSGPYVQDIFAYVPIKSSGLYVGQSYVDFSGSLSQQTRSYFGPVNIHRFSVQLVTDRGDVLDLNGADWQFSLTCEQLYNPTK